MSTTPITMNLANASERDVDTAIAIGAILDDLDNCNHPLRSSFIRDENGEWPEDDPDDFDPENGEHGKILAARLLKLLARSPGCLNRVIWGFSTARYNDVFDKDSAHLKLHPRLETALEKLNEHEKNLAQAASGYIAANQIASDAVRLIQRALKQGLTHSRKRLEEELPKLVARGQACTLDHQGPVHINSNVRLFDLVRFMRSELHEKDLITDEEYHWLCAEAPLASSPAGGSPSPRRLEDYDDLQDTLNRSKEALAWFIQQFQGDSGTGESHWQQFPEYRAAQATLATLQQSSTTVNNRHPL